MTSELVRQMRVFATTLQCVSATQTYCRLILEEASGESGNPQVQKLIEHAYGELDDASKRLAAATNALTDAIMRAAGVDE